MRGEQLIRLPVRNLHPASKGQRRCSKDMALVMAFLKPKQVFIKVQYILVAKCTRFSYISIPDNAVADSVYSGWIKRRIYLNIVVFKAILSKFGNC